MTEQLTPPVALPSPTPPLPGPLSIGWTPSDAALLRTAPLAAPSLQGARSLDALTAFHSAAPRFVTLGIDLALLLAVTAAGAGAGESWFRVVYPVAVLAVGYVGRMYADRDSVQTRGFLWYPGLLVTPVSAVALLGVALRALTVQDAVVAAAAAAVVLTAARALSWLALVVARRSGRGLRPTLLIGAPEATLTVQRRLAEFPEAGLAPARVLSFAAAHTPGAVQRELHAGNIRHIVLVAPSSADTPLVGSLPRQAEDAPFVSAVPALAELFVDPHSLVEVGGIPLIPLGRPTLRRHRFPGKRTFDVVLSSLMLLTALPVMATVALTVKLQDGGPVLFRQNRTGSGGRVFRIMKFRTMVIEADRQRALLAHANMTDGLLFKLRDDPRVTRVGRLLRRAGLDELPQLWNVLCGDMSMVGPRPLAADPEQFGPAESERHSVRPGITGYWQLSGGNELSYDEMIRLDLAYIRNWSLWLDLRLVLRTIPALLNRHGAA